MRMKWMQMGMLAVTLASAGAALADKPAAGATDDQSFLANALATNRLELGLGRMAIERAVTTTVQDMGRKMVEKHTALGQRLTDLVAATGSSSGEPATIDATSLNRLALLSGEQFDDAFVRTVDDSHRRELALYESEQKRTTSGALRALAAERVTALRKSLAERPQQEKGW